MNANNRRALAAWRANTRLTASERAEMAKHLKNKPLLTTYYATTDGEGGVGTRHDANTRQSLPPPTLGTVQPAPLPRRGVPTAVRIDPLLRARWLAQHPRAVRP